MRLKLKQDALIKEAKSYAETQCGWPNTAPIVIQFKPDQYRREIEKHYLAGIERGKK